MLRSLTLVMSPKPAGSADEAVAEDAASRSAGWRRLLPEGWALACLLLAGFALLKLAFNPGLGRDFLDGNYYFQIAQHVARGEGLKTTVSLYHQGLKSFPHEVNVAPIWPLTLGYVGRWIDLWKACEWLPEALYLVDLALLFLLADRLLRRFGTSPAAAVSAFRPTAAHLVLLGLALHPIFFEFTSAPYTEALAFGELFAALLLLDAYDRRPSFGLAAALGLLSALMFLTRGQFIAVGFALLLAAALALRAKRVGWGHLAVIGVVGSAAVVPWGLWIASWARPWKLWYMVATASYRATPELPPFQMQVQPAGFGGRVLDLLEGFRVAFSLLDPDGYAASFGPAVLVLPLALGLVLTRREWLHETLRRLGSRGTLLPFGTMLAALAALAPVHAEHGRFFKEWLFGFRHGLPFVLVLAWSLCLVFARGGRVVRIAALLLAAGSIFGGARASARLLENRYLVGVAAQEHAALEWIASQGPDVSFVTTRAQTLGPYSARGIHWMECRESPDRTLALLRYAGADFVLVYPEDWRCRFVRTPPGELEVAARFGQGSGTLTLLRLRPAAD